MPKVNADILDAKLDAVAGAEADAPVLPAQPETIRNGAHTVMSRTIHQ